MPNHVINKIKFECGDEKLKEILAAIQYDNDGEREFFGPGTIDFNKLIPMPKELDIVSGSSTRSGIELFLTAVNPLTSDFGMKKLSADAFSDMLGKLNRTMMYGSYRSSLSSEEIDKMTKFETMESLLNIGEKALRNTVCYGAPTWYEWCCNHWNTKWNAYECRYGGGDTIEFQTAWSAPHPILEELTARFPGVYITHQWADEDIGSNCGQLEYLNGECVGDLSPETDTDALEYSIGLWGYSPEDYNLSMNAAHTKLIRIENDSFEIVELFDRLMLFSNERLTDEDIPEGLFHYDLRLTDDGTQFGALETFAAVNHGGTIVSVEPIDLGESACIELSEENAPNFLGKELTFGQFMRGEYEQREDTDEGLTMT